MAEAATNAVDPVAGLIDIPLPPAISLWPQTWEARLACAGLVAAVLVAIIWLVWRWRKNRHRRAALAELNAIMRASGHERPPQVATDLALLVRCTALASFPREKIASLSGARWLAFLDQSYGGRDFSQGVGQALAAAPYSDQVAAPDIEPLAALVRRWIRTHHA